MSIGVQPTSSGGADVPEIGVGMLGYAFMGKAHANAYRTLPYMAWPPPLRPRLVSIAGRDGAAVQEAARRYGFERAVTDWRELVADPEVQLFDNSGPNNLHAEPTVAAAEAGKHVFCEKPLGRTAEESFDLWRRVEAAGVKHMTAFNYRFVPAVRLARQMIEAGELGEIHHFRGRYLQDWGTTTADAWRFRREEAGSGALGDLGAHVIDLARYLVGEISSVSASVATFMPGREVDDAFESVVEFEGGAVGTIEASRFAAGRKNALTWEINGSAGSLAFDLERLNELQVSEGAKASGRCSYPSPTIRSGRGGGRRATCSAGSTHSCTRCTICCRRSRRAVRWPARGDVRGRVPRRRGLRRDRSLGRDRTARDRGLSRLTSG